MMADRRKRHVRVYPVPLTGGWALMLKVGYRAFLSETIFVRHRDASKAAHEVLVTLRFFGESHHQASVALSRKGG